MAQLIDDLKVKEISIGDSMVVQLQKQINNGLNYIKNCELKVLRQNFKIIAKFDMVEDNEDVSLAILNKELSNVGGWKIFVAIAKVNGHEKLSLGVVTNFGRNGTYIAPAKTFLSDAFWKSSDGKRFKRVMVNVKNNTLLNWNKSHFIASVDKIYDAIKDLKLNQVLLKTSKVLHCFKDPVSNKYVHVLDYEYEADIPVFVINLCVLTGKKSDALKDGDLSGVLSSDDWINTWILMVNFHSFLSCKDGEVFYQSHYEGWADDDKIKYNVTNSSLYYMQ